MDYYVEGYSEAKSNKPAECQIHVATENFPHPMVERRLCRAVEVCFNYTGNLPVVEVRIRRAP